MSSRSKNQQALMRAVKHNPEFATKVGEDFVAADQEPVATLFIGDGAPQVLMRRRAGIELGPGQYLVYLQPQAEHTED